DLFLRRCDRHDVCGAWAVGVAPQCLEHHEGPDPVVDRARDQAIVRKLDGSRVDHTRIAYAKPLLGFASRGCADVDPEVGHLRGLVSILGLDEVNGLLAYDTKHVAVPADEADSLPDEDLRIPSADWRDEDVAVFVDVGDDHTDLIDVPREHDRRR